MKLRQKVLPPLLSGLTTSGAKPFHNLRLRQAISKPLTLGSRDGGASRKRATRFAPDRKTRFRRGTGRATRRPVSRSMRPVQANLPTLASHRVSLQQIRRAAR